MGRPEGNMAAAFVFDAYHYEKVFLGLGNDLPRHLRSPNPFGVDAWEGPHDDLHYRVSFMTEAVEPRGYDSKDRDWLGTVNFLDVGFAERAAWTGSAPTSRQFLLPTQIVFDPPGRIQLLPDISVFRIAGSLEP